MNWFSLGKQAALAKMGMENSHPLLRGTEIETDTVETPKPPKVKVWPPPPHATSGALINPKVARAASAEVQPSADNLV